MKQKSMRNALVVLCIIFLLPAISIASEMVTGTIVGINSLTHGEDSPIDANDPHVELEPDFVVKISDGSHYLIPLIPRELKVRYLYHTVKVTGEINKTYRAITVDKLQVRKKGKFKTIWTKKRWEEEQADLDKPDP